MSETKLKPCPFCGEVREENDESTYGLSIGRTKVWWVSCLTCGGVEGPSAKTRTGAIAAWNTRAPDPQRQRLVDALKALEKSCTQGMESGDWGFFGVENWSELAEARAVLKEVAE